MQEENLLISDSLFGDDEPQGQIHSFDWSITSLESLDQWSPILRTLASQTLAFRSQLPDLEDNAQGISPMDAKIETQFQGLLLSIPAAVCIFQGPQHIVVAANERMLALWEKTADQVMFKPGLEGLPEGIRQCFGKLPDQVQEQQKGFAFNDLPATLMRNGRLEMVFLNLVYEPFWQADGTVAGIVVVITEASDVMALREKMEESRQQRIGILNSLSSHIAVLNAEGEIIMVNDAWKQFAIENGGSALEGMGVGENYLAVLQRAEGPYSDEAPIVSEGIIAVLNGELPFYSMEYPCHSPVQQRWFAMKVSPLTSTGGGVIVAHTNVTEHRLLELALRESEQRLRLLSESLEQNLREHARVLAKMEEQLQAKSN